MELTDIKHCFACNTTYQLISNSIYSTCWALLLRPGWGLKYCNQHDCLLAYLKKWHPNFKKFPVHVIHGCGSILLWRQCSKLCTVLPVFWITSCFHIMGQIQIQASSLRYSELFTATCQKWRC